MKKNNIKTTFKSFLIEQNDWTVDYTLDNKDNLNIKYNDDYITKTPAEKWFLEQITDLKEIKSNNFPNSIFYKKNGEILFEYHKKTKIFWCHYRKIWLFLETEFGLNYQDTSKLIKRMVEEHLNLGDITPVVSVLVVMERWKNI